MAWNKDSIINLATVDSTNSYLRDEAENLWNKHGEEGFIIVTAEHQTAGRGQRGNTWNSNAGENLLFSILVRPGESLKVTDQFLLSQAVSLAIHDAMQHYNIDVNLKWPNDIYVGKRKLAGILLELDYTGNSVEQAIIGIGINVNQEEFPVMERIPVSIKMLKKESLALDGILTTIIDCFEHRYRQLHSNNRDVLATEYTKRLLGIDELHCFVDKNGRFEGVIKGVEKDGHLIVQRKDGGCGRYAFKEIEMEL